MPSVIYQDKKIILKDNQTVLEGLLEAGYDIPNACRAGACQSCKMVAREGNLPPASQQGLKTSEQNLGYFLSCSCTPSEDLTVADAASSEVVNVQVLGHTLLNAKVLELKLNAPFSFVGGQYITVWHDDSTPRSYSIASLPNDDCITLHIKLIESGLFSPYAFYSLRPGDSLRIEGPMGNCIYSAPNTEQPLILAAIGTGLGPIYAILRESLVRGHTAPIHLYAAAKKAQDLYLMEELTALAAINANLTVTFLAQEIGPNSPAIASQGDVYTTIQNDHPNTKGYGVYLCGAQSFVNKLKKQCFLGGANMQDIHADAFLACG